MSGSVPFALTEAQREQLARAVGAIMRLSAGCVVACEGREIDRPEQAVPLLEKSRFLDESTVELILSQVEAVADVLAFSELNPPRRKLAFLTIDTSPETMMFVDFEWKTNGAEAGRGAYPQPLLPGQLGAVQGHVGRLGMGHGRGAVMTGPADDHYNCMAWTLGVTDTPVWPLPQPGPVSLAAIDQLYARNGVERDFTGQISAWGHSDDVMHHLALQWTSGLWDSKLGRYIRAGHSLPIQFSGSYGRILHHYRFTMGPLAAARSFAAARGVQRERFRLSADGLVRLERAAAATDTELRRVFDELYRRWRERLADPREASAWSSNPYDANTAPEFTLLADLESGVVPLVLLRSARGDWCANALAEHFLPELRAGRATDDYVGEDVRAFAIAKAGLALIG